MTADGQNCSKILFKIQNSLNYAKITEMFKVLVWEFHSWWTSPSVGDLCFIIKLRGALSRAGQQKQFDSDQIWDCQRKQVALLQHQRWKENFFFRNWGYPYYLLNREPVGLRRVSQPHCGSTWKTPTFHAKIHGTVTYESAHVLLPGEIPNFHRI